MTMTNTAGDPTQQIQATQESPEISPEEAQRQLPQFATAVRGYDRAQVDDYLIRFHQWLEEAEARTRHAEAVAGRAAEEAQLLRQQLQALEQQSSLPTPTSMTAFGERIGHVLDEAVQAARALHQEAEGEARQLKEQSIHDGDLILQRAQAEAAKILEAAQLHEQDIRRQIDELVEQRAAALGELRSIRSRLAELLESPVEPAGGGPEEPYDAEAAAPAASEGDHGHADPAPS